MKNNKDQRFNEYKEIVLAYWKRKISGDLLLPENRNAKTLKALKGSIKKWERIVEGKGEDDGIHNCPLCGLFQGDSCVGCPVRDKVKKKRCADTPYVEWEEHQDMMHSLDTKKVHCPICQRLAKEEVEFLKSLLPKKKIKK